MTHYETRGAVLDRLLAEHNIDSDDVLSVDLAKNDHTADIRVHIYNQVPGLTYQPTEPGSRHQHANVEREDLRIRVVYVHDDSKEVAA